METGQVATRGVGFNGLLTLLFIALKLTHVIAWSWWWVLSPLWIGAGLFVGVLLGVVIAAVAMTFWPKRKK